MRCMYSIDHVWAPYIFQDDFQNCIEFLVIPQNVLQFQLNHVELSPNYAGTLFGITNMVANLTGFITPWVAGNITNYNVRRSNSCLSLTVRIRQMAFLWHFPSSLSANIRILENRLSYYSGLLPHLQHNFCHFCASGNSTLEYLLATKG